MELVKGVQAKKLSRTFSLLEPVSSWMEHFDSQDGNNINIASYN